MSEPEDFLTRWSRRKVATAEQDQPEQDAAPAVEPGDDEGCGSSLSTLLLKSWACFLDAMKHG